MQGRRPVLRRRFLNGYEVMKDLHVRMQEARNEMPNYGELYGEATPSIGLCLMMRESAMTR